MTTVFTGVDFRTSSTTTVAGDRGTLVMEYSGATVAGGNGHVWVRRSTDGGIAWSAATELANGSANASFPAIAGGAAGDFRLTWMDARGGAWNVYYRSSTDGGQTWAPRPRSRTPPPAPATSRRPGSAPRTAITTASPSRTSARASAWPARASASAPARAPSGSTGRTENIRLVAGQFAGRPPGGSCGSGWRIIRIDMH